MTATSASVRFGTGGVAGVQSSLRLTGDSYITCYTYDDRGADPGDRRCARQGVDHRAGHQPGHRRRRDLGAAARCGCDPVRDRAGKARRR